jgi:hypothetical protein
MKEKEFRDSLRHKTARLAATCQGALHSQKEIEFASGRTLLLAGTYGTGRRRTGARAEERPLLGSPPSSSETIDR